MMTPDRTRDRDPADDVGDARNPDDGIDEAAGGADSSPSETQSSDERAKELADGRKSGASVNRQDGSP